MYKRFFAFGCSFTDYPWTTWADIIAGAYPGAQYYNFSKAGGSNQLILSRVMEADSVFNFNEQDLVIVQWTSANRESRYIINRWRGSGNVYNDRNNYGEDFFKYIDPLDYTIRDCAAIKAVYSLLKLKQCNYKFIASVPLIDGDTNEIKYLLQTYQPVLDFIKPSFLDVIFKGDFAKNDTRLLYGDSHPDPEQHLRYVETVLPEIPISNNIRTMIQQDINTLLSLPRTVEDSAPGKPSLSWGQNVNNLWLRNSFRTLNNSVARNTNGLRF
jgi:hypothetical protein